MEEKHITTGNELCAIFHFKVGKYKIMIKKYDNETENKENEYGISIFRNENNVTYEIFKEHELISEDEAHGDQENLLKAIDYCKIKQNMPLIKREFKYMKEEMYILLRYKCGVDNIKEDTKIEIVRVGSYQECKKLFDTVGRWINSESDSSKSKKENKVSEWREKNRAGYICKNGEYDDYYFEIKRLGYFYKY